jgi:hypothetical protein
MVSLIIDEASYLLVYKKLREAAFASAWEFGCYYRLAEPYFLRRIDEDY